MRGRKPKPPELKLLAGERPDRINGAAPQPAKDRPEAPAYLDDEGRAEWERIVPLLEAMGVLSSVDGSALSVYCEAFSTWIQATKALKAEGFVTAGASGAQKTSPYVGIAREAAALMTKLLIEFGATPSARSRVRVPDQADKDSLGEFLNKRKAR